MGWPVYGKPFFVAKNTAITVQFFDNGGSSFWLCTSPPMAAGNYAGEVQYKERDYWPYGDSNRLAASEGFWFDDGAGSNSKLYVGCGYTGATFQDGLIGVATEYSTSLYPAHANAGGLYKSGYFGATLNLRSANYDGYGSWPTLTGLDLAGYDGVSVSVASGNISNCNFSYSQKTGGLYLNTGGSTDNLSYNNTGNIQLETGASAANSVYSSGVSSGSLYSRTGVTSVAGSCIDWMVVESGKVGLATGDCYDGSTNTNNTLKTGNVEVATGNLFGDNTNPYESTSKTGAIVITTGSILWNPSMSSAAGATTIGGFSVTTGTNTNTDGMRNDTLSNNIVLKQGANNTPTYTPRDHRKIILSGDTGTGSGASVVHENASISETGVPIVTTGTTYTVPEYRSTVVFLSMGITTMDITLPAFPVDGLILNIQAVDTTNFTVLTLIDPNSYTIYGAPAAMAANTAFTLQHFDNGGTHFWSIRGN